MKSPEWINANRKVIEKGHGKFLEQLRRDRIRGIDEEVRHLDAEVFATTNCLTCANCCKTISPVFKSRDVKVLARHLGMRETDFFSEYLTRDADGDMVLQRTPCPFLEHDNTCRVYAFRPDACRGYPHTGTLPFRGNTALMIKNSAVCPAVFEMVERLKQKYT